jgi:branched-chain amino acid transport system permease protein
MIALQRKSFRFDLRFFCLPAVIGALLFLPFFLPKNHYFLHIAIMTSINIIMGCGWNMLSGLTGQASFAHSVFFGVGAYTTALLWLGGMHPYLTMPLAGIAAALYSLVVGVPCLRLRGPFFIIGTLAAGEVTRIIANNFDKIGGAAGLSIPPPSSYSKLPHYYVTLICALCVIAVSAKVIRSRFGMALFAIRENYEAAETVGIDTTRFQIYALLISSLVVGIAGSLYVQYIFYALPDKVFGFDTSICMILMTVIGGIGTLWGPVLGAILFFILQEFLLGYFPNLHLGIYGVILMVLVLFEPGGILNFFAGLRFRSFYGLTRSKENQ